MQLSEICILDHSRDFLFPRIRRNCNFSKIGPIAPSHENIPNDCMNGVKSSLTGPSVLQPSAPARSPAMASLPAAPLRAENSDTSSPRALVRAKSYPAPAEVWFTISYGAAPVRGSPCEEFIKSTMHCIGLRGTAIVIVRSPLCTRWLSQWTESGPVVVVTIEKVLILLSAPLACRIFFLQSAMLSD